MSVKTPNRKPLALRAVALAMVIAVVALGTALLMGREQVQAATAGGAAFDINGGNDVTVGGTYGYVWSVTNTSTAAQANESIEVTNITGYPACNATELSNPLCMTAANQNPGVFVPVGNATGVAGGACEGITFTIAVDATGLWTFTPDAPVILSPLSLAGPDITCGIEGDVSVEALPDDALPAAPGTQTNQLARADLTSVDTDFPGIGLGSVGLTVRSVNVSIEKTAVTTPINAGGMAGFTITVTNEGPDTASNVVVNDPLPGTGWAESPDNPDCSIAANVLSCTFASIAFPGSESVTVQRATTVSDCGDLPNTATVSADDDTDPTDNSDSATIVVNCPNVSIEKTAATTPINAGATASFTITVTNEGPGTATNVMVNDPLPGTGWVENPDNPDCSIAADVLTCNVVSLAFPGSFSVTVERPTTVSDCGTLNNTATVTADSDTDPTDNSDSASIVVNCPNVSIAKTAATTPINAGATASFTITVTNEGPGTATNVMVNDPLPGTGWVENPDNPNCSIAANVLSCTFASIAFPGSASVTVERTTTTADCGTLHNVATVTADSDTDPTDNMASADIVVVCPAGEGCTPGFWKTHQDLWDTTLTFGDFVVTGASSTVLLVDALNFGGGSGLAGATRNLLRAAAAALLNADDPNVNYEFTEAEIADMVNDAIASGDRAEILDVASDLDEANNAGCSIDAHGNPI